MISKKYINVLSVDVNITNKTSHIITPAILYFDIDEGHGNFQLYYIVDNDIYNVTNDNMNIAESKEIDYIVKTKKLKQQFKNEK